MFSKIKELVLKYLSYVGSVAVEISGLLHYVSILANRVILQDILLERSCEVDLNYPKENCTEMVRMQKQETERNPLEAEAQAVVASIISVKSVLDNLPVIFFILYFGQWSDRNGRKLPLVISSTDGLLQSFVLILCLLLPQLNGYTIGVVSSLPRVLFGGDVIFAMAALSYLTDTTKESSRTFRLGMLGAIMHIGVPIGSILAGFLLETKGISYTVCLLISGSFSLVGTLFVIFGVNDNKKELSLLHYETRDQEISCCSGIYQVLKDLMAVPFKRRDNNRRMKIILLLVAIICGMVPVYGEFNVLYLFVRNRLNWGPLEFGYFSTFRTFSHTLGMIFMMGILSYKLRIPDPILGFLSVFSQYGCSLMYIFASTAGLFYLALAFECFQAAMYTIAQAMLTKLIDPTEVGKTCSLMSLIQVINPLLMSPLYSSVYSITLNSFPPAVFVLSLIAVVPTQLIYLWFICSTKRSHSSSASTPPPPISIHDLKSTSNETSPLLKLKPHYVNED